MKPLNKNGGRTSLRIPNPSGSSSNFLRPHYPEVTNCSLSEMEEVLRQVNNEINRSGLNLISNDYLNFTLFWDK